MFPTIPQSAVVVLAGIAGSGKSTWAQQWFRDTEILSSDRLRAMLTDDEEHRSCSGDAFKMLKTLLDLRLTYGRRVVVDATSLKREARRPYLEAAKAHNVPAMLVWFDIPEEVCRRRQHQRSRKVPVHAIRRQAELVEMLPTQILDEPWDAIGRVGWVPPSHGGPKLEFELLRAWSPPRITRPTASSAQLMVPGLDIIGDVHGCSTELDALLAQLGWSREGQSGHWSHPEDRMVVFVGDLTDRGPDSIGVLLRAVTMVDQGQALLVRGNHDDKLLRWLQGRSVELKHGLETTVAEFEDLTHDQRKALTQTATTLIANSPLWATWHAPQGLIGDPELVIAHAAWSPDVPRWPLGRARAYCLFGPTTSTPSPDGLPQRLDWRQRYPTRGPSCVFGHSPFQGPVQWYRNTLALDTACVFGHRLSALRWPERDVVQVDARAPYAEPRRPLEPAPPYVLEPMEETPMNDTDANLQLGPDAAFELRLDRLLESLHRQPEAILSRIDGDAMLLKREGVTPHGQTVVIVNASKSLFTPQHTHQLYAKGLVYTRQPWRPVSIPFLKIYNLGERDDTRALAVELSRQKGVTAHFNDKLDGTMVQSCCIASQVVLTTRGTFDLADPATSGFDYLGEARRLLRTQSPGALDPDQVQGHTLLWELIHPESRLVTDYGDRKALILTGAVDHRDREPRYVTRSELEALAVQLQAPLAEEYALEGDTLEAQVEALEAMLRDTDLEGAVITFEGRDHHGRPAVLHRVKVKGAHYLSLMRQMTRCTYARTRQLLQLNPELRTWETLRDHLMNLGSDEVPEEILGAYRSHLETWQARQKELGQLAHLAQEAFQAIEAHMGAPPEQRDAAYGEWRKMFARWLHTHAPEVRGLLFQAADGKLDVERLERMFGDDPQGLATAAGQLRDVTRSIAPG